MWTTAERATTISLSPPSIPRLHLRPGRPPGVAAPSLDGGWWPRTEDPVAELPGLIQALQDHRRPDGQSGQHAAEHGTIVHILARVADWDTRPRRLRVEGPAGRRVVRLGWFDTLPAGLLTAIYSDGDRIDLLIVPPDTDPAQAAAAMELAAHPDNHLATPALLATLTIPAAGHARPHQADGEFTPAEHLDEGRHLTGHAGASTPSDRNSS